ncbi:nucleoporin Nup145p [[Candida] jaroonii]|uniref:Nucleoporin Nup145p n=1 Tax=[Candida] jaroonii TaxID=467808 RepID=A0ACA9Y3B7_9ASCO|nr:nucleoporin Nup145p [[Candida] jaroonii]
MFGSSNSSWQQSGGFNSLNKPPSLNLNTSNNNTNTSGGLFGNASNPTINSNSNNNTNSGGLFGNSNSTATSGGLFGNDSNKRMNTGGSVGSNMANNTGSNTSGGLFGNSTNNANSSTGLFGGTKPTSSGGLFGGSAANTSSGLFGNSNATTSSGISGGSTSNTTSGLFGNSTTSSGLSNGTNPSSAGGLFSKPSGGLFGSSTNTTNTNAITGNTNSGSLFGNPSSTANTSGGFFGGNQSNTSTINNSNNVFSQNDAYSSNAIFRGVTTNFEMPASITAGLFSAKTETKPVKIEKKQPSVLSRLAKKLNIFKSVEQDPFDGIFASNDFPSTKSLTSTKNKISKPISFSKVETRSSNEIKKLIIKSKPVKFHLINAEKVLTSKQWRVMPELITTEKILNDDEESDNDITNIIDENLIKASKIVNGTSDLHVPSEVKPKIDIETSEGYWTSPALSTLKTWSLKDLSQVDYFIVGRKGFGQIAFNLPVDLSDLQQRCFEEHKALYDILFKEIIEIGVKYVKVYKDNTNKPQRGCGLNVPATITLEKVEPKQGNDLSSFIKMLQSREGMEFVTYDPITFSWTFKVQHFSIWGLVDEVETSDTSNSDEDTYYRELKKQKINRETTGLPGNWSIEDTSVLELKKRLVNNEIDSHLTLNSGVKFDEATPEPIMEDKPIRENYEYLKDLINVFPQNADLSEIVKEKAYEPEIDNVEDFKLIKATPNLPVSDNWLVQLNLANDLNSSLANFHNENIVKDGKLQLSTIDDILFQKFNESADSNSKEVSTPSTKSDDKMEIDDLIDGDKFEQIKIYSSVLPTLLDNSEFQKRSNNAFKVLKTDVTFGKLVQNDQFLPHSFIDILTLCSTLFDQSEIKIDDISVKDHLKNLQQKQSFVGWLQKYNEGVVEELISKADDSFEEIFIHICSGQLKKAIESAINSNNNHLSAVLTSIDSNYQGIKQVAKSQLEEWQNNNFIPRNLIKIYKFIAGDNDEILSTLPWNLRLACNVYYSESKIPLHQAIDEVIKGSSDTNDILEILRFYCNYKTSPKDAIERISSATLNIGIKWVLLKIINEISSDELSISMGRFIEKLGLWKESMFIYSHISQDKVSEKYIRRVIQANIKKIKNDNSNTDEEPFLTNILKIPSSLIYESVATDMDSNKEYWKACDAFIIATSWEQAHDIIVNKLGPQTIISKNPKDIQLLLESMSKFPNQGKIIPIWAQSAGIFQKYFKLLPFIKSGNIGPTLIPDVETLLEQIPLLKLDNSLISKATKSILVKDIGDLAINLQLPDFKSKITSLPLGENEQRYFEKRLA